MLKLTEISRRYPGKVPVTALNRLNLSVERGEFVSIVGSSGSGKSTLMHILGCLDRPDEGQYLLDGRDISRASASTRAAIRREYIGFVFQNFQLIEGCTALENVELSLILRGYDVHTRHRLAREALDAVGLSSRMHHRPGALSGGQQQRVAIARACVGNSPLILADEPTGNLDGENAASIMALLSSLHSQGRTLILITHDPNVAKQAQRQLRLENGILREL